MSHFTVLVIGEDPERQLAPFGEYCGDDDFPKEFLEFKSVEEECRMLYENGRIDMVKVPKKSRYFKSSF